MISPAYRIFILYNVTHNAVHDLVRVCICVRVCFPDFEVLQHKACFMGGLSPPAVINELTLKQHLNSEKQI